MATKLFPPYLDQGSTGAAVNVLGLLMKATKFEHRSAPIVLDGDYTPAGAIASAVKLFQTWSTFEDADIDGNFGPKTRAAFKEAFGVDVDELTVEMFAQPTVGKGP